MSYKHSQAGDKKLPPDELLSVYTKRLELVQNRIFDLGEPERYVGEIQDYTAQIINILGEGGLALVSGKELLIPEINRETGQYRTIEKIDCLEKQFKDIIWIQPTDNDGRNTVMYYRLINDNVTIDSPYQYTQSSLYMLAPVASSELRLPFDFKDAFIPEEDDYLASQIDKLLLNTPVSLSLSGLNTLVSEHFADLSDLQQYSYLKHMNTLFNVQDVKITTAKYMLIDTECSEASRFYTNQSSIVCEGVFQSFIICTTETPEYPYPEKESLVLVIKTQSGYTGVFVDDIEDIKTSPPVKFS